MRIVVPILVESSRGESAGASIVAQPLYHTTPRVSGDQLGRVLAKLSLRLRSDLSLLAEGSQHEPLLRWHNIQPIDAKSLKLHLDLRDITATINVLLVTVQRHGRNIVFSPTIPDVWFDIEKGESLLQRATDVYQAHFRQLRKSNPNYSVVGHGTNGKAWVDQLVIDLIPRRGPREKVDPLRALLGGEDVSDGGAQLQQVGRCLSWLSAGELVEPIGVDEDVRRLASLLEVADRRGVVLVGPSGSGKTARIEGVVHRRLKRKRAMTHGLVWHLSPARLISGMSYLGQWQQRVQSILGHAYRYDHVLYFDDLLGLYEAGKTRDSKMCVADMLRAQLEIRPVRILAEMTAQAWSILQERDRTFADRFLVLPTQARTAEASMEILLGVRRQLEDRHRCEFHSDVIPEVVSMYDRFERSSVLPGKAAGALIRLAGKSAHQTISRADAIAEFRSRSGLSASMIDQRAKITRESLEAQIREHVVGQTDAVRQLIDCVLVAAAKMNDTTRPLGTFLLVGPTGVGKTQLAKAMANCLFDQSGLIRLDMNELSSPAAASRLIGTFEAPDGLLTTAVRRRPHAVLLLDEIEKAHPSVLDVLLQALGEARLSDARGRTVDLSGLLILMTSNLGTRRSGRAQGFADVEDPAIVATVHDKAVRDFFRPEFFNRIDAVLHFQRLSRETIHSIAKMQFDEILHRDGLQRRSVLVDVDPDALARTADQGYDPTLGARALKRRIERDLIQPAARALAATTSDQPMLLRLHVVDERVAVEMQRIELLSPATPPLLPDHHTLREWATRQLENLSTKIGDARVSLEYTGQSVDPAVLESMMLRDSLHDCQDRLRALVQRESALRLDRPPTTPVHAGKGIGPVTLSRESQPRWSIKDSQAIDDILEFLKESHEVPVATEIDAQRNSLIDAIIKLRRQFAYRGTPHKWILTLRWIGDANKMLVDEHRLGKPNVVVPFIIGSAIGSFVTDVEGFDCDLVGDHDNRSLLESGFCISGAMANEILELLTGGWMLVDSHGGLSVCSVAIAPVLDDEPLATQVTRCRQQQADSPVPVIRRLLHVESRQVDLLNGATVNGRVTIRHIVDLLKLSRRGLDGHEVFMDTSESPQ